MVNFLDQAFLNMLFGNTQVLEFYKDSLVWYLEVLCLCERGYLLECKMQQNGQPRMTIASWQASSI